MPTHGILAAEVEQLVELVEFPWDHEKEETDHKYDYQS